jgi:hypothetical protein
MHLIWFLAIPLWIFGWICTARGVLMVAMPEKVGRAPPWWGLPLWMAVGVPGLFLMLFGIMVFGYAGATGTFDIALGTSPHPR